MANNDAFYPPLNSGAVKAILTIRDQMQSNPKFLDNSPYPMTVQTDLKNLLENSGSDTLILPILTEDDIKDLDAEKEVSTLFLNLRNFEKLATSLEPNDRLAIFRVSTSLMEKLIALKEKSADLKMYLKFKETVIAAVTKYLSQEQLSEFMEMIQTHTQTKK